MLALLGQRSVIHDQYGVLAAYQGVSRLAQHLFQRRSGPGRRGYEVVELLCLPRTHALGHRLDTLACPRTEESLQIEWRPAALLETLKGSQKWL